MAQRTSLPTPQLVATSYAAATTTVPLRQPSLFDLLASDSLLQTIRPALKKLVQSLADLPGGGGRGGEFGRWVRRWGDEVTLLLEIGLHYYFLRKHGAGFAENFYGLRRVVDGDDAGELGFHSVYPHAVPSLLGLCLANHVLILFVYFSPHVSLLLS